MNYFYPQDQQILFTDRKQELDELNYYRRSLLDGTAEHIALFGLRRIGKTLLLKELIRRTLSDTPTILPVYLDFSAICSSPENFVSGFIGLVCYWVLEKGQQNPEPYLSPSTLPLALSQAGAKDLLEYVQPILQELERSRPDRQVLLRRAFSFPHQVVAAREVSLMLVFDEFQEIRTLENYPNSRNVIALYRSEIQTQSKIQYILAGSAITILSNMLSDPQSPLFTQFTRLSVGTFSRESTRELAIKLVGGTLGEDLYPVIHSLTNGHPYYITALCRRLNYFIDVVKHPVSSDTIKQAFLVETLTPGGRIYDFCRYVYDLSLQKASGYGSLKAILQILAVEEGLTTSQIARKLHVTPGSASDYLRWLCGVDLTTEKDHTYYYRDPILRFWVGNVVSGIEVSLTTEPLDLKGLIARLDAQFQRVSEELGTAQESLVRELLRQFDGQMVEGMIFGNPVPIRLPVFAKVEEYTSVDGQVELDAVAIAPDLECWVVEVKWRNRRTGLRDLEKLNRHAKKNNARGWFISRSGFTDEAVDYARKSGVYITDAEGLKCLRKLLA